LIYPSGSSYLRAASIPHHVVVDALPVRLIDDLEEFFFGVDLHHYFLLTSLRPLVQGVLG